MTLSTRISAATILSLALAAGSGALGAETVSERWERSFPLPATGEVVVVNPNGDVTVEMHGGPEVRVVADKKARAGSRERALGLLRDLDLRVHQTSKGLEIRVVPVRTGGWLGWIDGDARAGADLSLHLPSGPVSLRVKSDNGDIGVRFFGRSALLETTNGRISVYEMDAHRVEANSVNGDILLHLEALAETARVDLGAVNGNVRIVAPDSIRASIDARTVNGCVGTSLDFAEGHRTRSKLIGAFNGGGGQIRVRTTNGRVWVKKD